MTKVPNNYKLIILLVLITVTAFFRFWEIRNYVVFLGDEGRDMIVMRNIFVEKNLPFLGPTASVGGFYLGPIYYWMAAPFLLLLQFDPVGPSYFVAIIGVATVLLLYKFLKEAIGFWPAVLSSFLYAVAPLIVRYSRSSWNPNPLPFFALLMIYFIFKGIKDKKLLYFLGAGASFGIAIQLHYLALILIAITGLIVVFNSNLKKLPSIAFFSIIGFSITFSPFLLFEIRHGFPNFNTIIDFVTRGTTAGFTSANFISLISSLGNTFLEEISLVKGTLGTKIFFWFLTLGGILGFYLNRNSNDKILIFSIGLIWFLGGILGLRFYSGQIYDYYFGFMFPAPFILFGLILYVMWKKFILRLIGIVLSIVLIVFFLDNAFYKNPPNRIINQTSQIADLVIDKTGEDPYNFALISESNSDHAYRYFLELRDKKPIDLETMVTEQLLVVCESKKCEPLGHPVWEIAGFGRAEIAQEQDLEYGIKVFRLIHWPGVPSPAGKPAIKGS
ncbi:hypothetical protein A3G14_00900 [Candidatus Curtissbacteria bacterium RIFCSPLOWO2_12_FULL_38_9]|uniref:Glycosyltransferase RgtA/B/C/D-like domain-containing protein n=1 Tax=Candidatus Curtissbacteria bacterium RIFCSPLOWO2_12_FULL_38_9 TaxID=1797735 RepID=A0A1F5I8Y1_9BACT|nr:MAG: hypothetical protein A3G14_00900 [Candidatus Curtissbacteria bacterium RIFCSPLOWO2_12_FULL_38_9]